MTIANLIERLKAPAVTPVTPATAHGVTVKNTPTPLFLLGEVTSVTPVTPVTPKKVEGENQNTELAHAAPVWVAPAPPDPGMAPLLALAMAYCDCTGASPKARADWQADIEATPPGDREGLASYLRKKLAKLAPVAPAMPSKAAPTAPASTTWQQHDKADQAHYWGCPQCLAVVKTGKGHRCTAGQQLHDAYMQAASREGRFLGARPDPAKPVPPFHAAQPWREADKQWLAHWQQCPQCQTAERTGTARCNAGEALHQAYMEAIA